MNSIPYISVIPLEVPILKKDIILCIEGNQWRWRRNKFDNHNMALMLIEILYRRNQINEATYQKIMKKYQEKIELRKEKMT